MNDPTAIAQQLRTHPWVKDACCSGRGALLALSASGIDALHRSGRQPLTEVLAAHAGIHPAAPSWAWRLFDTLPADARDRVDALLEAPLPRDAIVLDEQQDGDEWTLQLRVPLDLIYFPGHFPQAPVLPGAVQIAWALAFAASRLGTPGRCHAIEALKFQQLLRPGDHAALALRHDTARGKLHFAYRQGNTAYSSGRLVWSTAS